MHPEESILPDFSAIFALSIATLTAGLVFAVVQVRRARKAREEHKSAALADYAERADASSPGR